MSEREYYENYNGEDPEIYIRRYLLEVPAEMERFATIVQHLPESAHNLLDVGCGAGILLKLLRESRPEIEALGLERSRPTTEAGRRLFGVNIVEGSASELPFADKSFDVVTASEVIEHLPYGTYERALRELQRVARRFIVITVPYRERRTAQRCPYCDCAFHPSYHMRSFDEHCLHSLFATYRVERTVYCGYVAEPVGAGVLRALLPRFRPAGLPPYAICPQCGYRRGEASHGANTQAPRPATLPSLAGRVLRRLVQICSRRRPRWVLVLYGASS
jgi:SAM-dependent methyltransferase